MPMYGNMNYGSQRDDIADTLMQQQGRSAFDFGLAGLASAMQPHAPMTGPTLPVCRRRQRVACRVQALDRLVRLSCRSSRSEQACRARCQ